MVSIPFMPRLGRPCANLPNLFAADCCHTVFVFGLVINSRYSILLPVLGLMTELAKKGGKWSLLGGSRKMLAKGVSGASCAGMVVARDALGVGASGSMSAGVVGICVGVDGGFFSGRFGGKSFSTLGRAARKMVASWRRARIWVSPNW